MNLGAFYCLWPNSPSFDNSLHILHRKFQLCWRFHFWREASASPSLSHIYSNYARNSREVVKMIVRRKRKKDPLSSDIIVQLCIRSSSLRPGEHG